MVSALSKKSRPALAFVLGLLCLYAGAEITTSVDTAVKTDEAGRVPQIRTTVKTIDTQTSRELKRVTKVTDFNTANATMVRVTKTVEIFDSRTGEKIRVTYVETKRDQKTGAPVRTIAVANYDPVSKQMVSKGSSVEYADSQGKFYRPEPSDDVASLDETANRAAPVKRNPQASFSSPFQIAE